MLPVVSKLSAFDGNQVLRLGATSLRAISFAFENHPGAMSVASNRNGS